MKKRNKTGAVILFFYLLCVGVLTGPSLHQLLVWRLPAPRLSLVPFADLIEILQDKNAIGLGAFANIAGNILMFVPFGLILPLFWVRYRKFWRTALAAFTLSLSIELIQLTAGGVTSVDDLLLNLIGGLLGYALACACLPHTRHLREIGDTPRAWRYPLGCWLLVVLLATLSDFVWL